VAKKNARDNERRAIVEQLRKEQARKERTRSFAILGVCVVIVIGLLAAALIPYIKSQKEKDKPLADVGAAQSAAACSPIQTKTATGNQDHVTPGTKVNYPDAPPSFGKHWGNFLTGSEIRSMYTTSDRPEVERLVHSLEHGYSILWYDATVKKGTTAYDDVVALSQKLPVGKKFIAAPWTSSDGNSFPSGKHVALTHWTGPDDQKGVTEFCGKPSGAVVSTFMKRYPEGDAPEPGAV
jgi:hypothetical protein